MLSDFSELFEVSSEQVLRFFFEHLGNEVASTGVAQIETLYVASILAHYAMTSRDDPRFMATSGSLYDILDTFVLSELTEEGNPGLKDPEILETAGSQTLLLVGFFRDQMKRKHNLGMYDNLGRSFFRRASNRFKEKRKVDLLRRVARHFPFWAMNCRNMSRNLRDERYALKLN